MRILTTFIVAVCWVAILLVTGAAVAQEIFSPDQLVVTASGASGSYTPDRAVDGNVESRWVSSPGRSNQWIQIQFPKSMEFSSIRIQWANANTMGSSVMISLSADGREWVDVFEDFVPTTAEAETFSFAPQWARFCRLTFTPPERGNVMSILEISFGGVRIQEPFHKHVGIGSGNGEPWLSSPGERLAVDVLFPIYTETFTWAFPAEQEYLVMKNIVDYRDWFEQVVGHYVYENYHLALVDVPLSRSEIDGDDTFWMTPTDVWNNLKLAEINPGEYDLVWALWAWKNIPGAVQRYGGAALNGPDGTPFMSLSVSSFAERSQGIIMVLEHEAHHTWESLFRHSGLSVNTTPPLTGLPHADYLDTMLDEMVRLEPGFMEPFMSDEQVLEHRRGGSKGWPGLTLQRGVNAWTYRLQPREHWLQVAEYVGKTASARGDIVVQPLFASVSIVTDRGPEREIYLPVRVRDQGWHIPNVKVTATVNGQVYTLEEDTIYRHSDIRMPRQERWSVGWDGNGIYGGWITVTKDTEAIEIRVQGQGLDETFTIPVNYINVETQQVTLLGPEMVFDRTATSDNGRWTFGEDGDYVIFQIPNAGAKAAVMEAAGSGWVELAVSGNGRQFLAVYQGELTKDPQTFSVRPEFLGNQEYLYVRLRMAPDYKRPLSAPSVSEVTDLKIVFRSYNQ